jgi:serine/threonine protein kinase
MQQKLYILQEVALGLAELHQAGIVHGDIKPANILLDSRTNVYPKIRFADFGLSHIRDAFADLLSSTTALSMQQTRDTRGTPVYCAPEMFANPYTDRQVAGNVGADEGGDPQWAGAHLRMVAKPSRKTDMYVAVWTCTDS